MWTAKCERMRYQYIIGIDVGVNTGYALWDCTMKQLIEVKTYTALEAMAAVRNLITRYCIDNLYLRFEDARKRRWFGKKGREALQGAGSVKRDSKLWQEFCTTEGIAYEAVAPRKGMTKLDSETFRKVTKWTGRTSEHSRDAGMLVFGFNQVQKWV